ncbi:MAG: hypothetical protein K6A67_06410, partial [Bacteroidales bacterium]|nr:hypothetical protein [Bacteroidales bacterium]
TISEEYELQSKIVGSMSPNILDLLGDTFSREELRALRVKLSKDPNPRIQLAQWKIKGFITLDEKTGLYHKTPEYLLRHSA